MAPHTPWPDHLEDLISNVEEVLRLVEIHEELTGTAPGRRRQVEVLNKSGVVLLVACWEAYIEDLATAAFDFLFGTAATHDLFPQRVLTIATKEIRASQDHRKVWDLAGTGWRNVLQAHKDTVLKEFVGNLNTPKPEQIDGLFENLIGITTFSNCWKWQKTSPDSARTRLTTLVELRGDIAHRVSTSTAVKKKDVLDASDFINRLAALSSNRVRDFLRQQTGKPPWGEVQYEGTA